MTQPQDPNIDWQELANNIKSWGTELGFQKVAISDIQLGEHETHLKNWLSKNYHGEMNYMAAHGNKRSRPEELVPGTLKIITARMNYLAVANNQDNPTELLEQPEKAYISRYALGRDYHKVIRKRLQKLAQQIQLHCSDLGYRPFVDSAPVLEKALAEKSGLGWIGKHTLLLDRDVGSWFFLGELFTDLPLPTDEPVSQHCGNCSACIDVCPTQAIVAPYQLDARLCISYLTIELKSAIPEPLRKPMGNRVFGCDDCQLVCPWNRFAKISNETDFKPRHQLDNSELLTLFLWDEDTFLKNTEGSPIRRVGYSGWLRNLSVGLGNAPYSAEIVSALKTKVAPCEMVSEHIHWAIQEQLSKAN